MTIDHKTEQTLAEIAKKELGIETLETRRNGSLDFHELAVWNVRNALIAAYELGRQSVINQRGK